jgi:UDP-glucuronate 4-epimerase
MKVLVTGAAGFIGFHTCNALLDSGAEIIGVDNLNDYYDVQLKRDRLAKLNPHHDFNFYQANIANKNAILQLADKHPDITHIVHLAAQAGVRYSLENPYSYVESNVMGQVVMSELARSLPMLEHFVYASSSSVYGGNTKLPFSVEDSVDHPVSLYAATKKADELIGHTYSHLYGIPSTGLRFFTVYGPWGRPDMAYFMFAKAILANKPIRVFDNGNMQRDFTYIDDIVSGILATMKNPPKAEEGKAPHRVLNLGNNKSEKLMDFIEVIEDALGKKAEKIFEPRPAGDVPATFADIENTTKLIGYKPTTSIDVGLPKFIEWYLDYYKERDKADAV